MTTGAAATELSALTEAIDGLELSVDREVIVGALRERDRLDARIAAAAAVFDAAELWDCDGATSMTRWLVTEGRLGDGAARRLVRTASRLEQWPVLARAFAEGTVSAGQVELIAQRVRPHHVALFADHEAALVPALALLDLDATITVVREWVDKADALADTEPTVPKASTLHVNAVGDRGRLDSDLTSDDLAIVAEALRLATRSDDDTDPRRRTRAERAADALVDMSRRFLRDHETPKTSPGRQRPGVNVVIDAPTLAALELRELGIATIAELDDFLDDQPTTAAMRAWHRSGLDHLTDNPGPAATTLTGHDLSPALAAAFCCDATMRRLLAAGSTLLDYGRPMPTLPKSVARRRHPPRPPLPLPGLSPHRRLVRGPPHPPPRARRSRLHRQLRPALRPPPPRPPPRRLERPPRTRRHPRHRRTPRPPLGHPTTRAHQRALTTTTHLRRLSGTARDPGTARPAIVSRPPIPHVPAAPVRG